MQYKNNMRIIYNSKTNKYNVTDFKGNWYATGQTMIEAINRALSIKLYWLTLSK